MNMENKKISFDFIAHILVVDDDAGIRELLGRHLKKEGFLVSLAENAFIAEKLISEMKFDLIITDKMMPRKDGIQFLDDIRKAGNATPLIMLTAVDDMETKLTGLSIGADDYIAKPFEPKELVLRIKNILKRIQNTQKNLGEVIRFGKYTFDTKNQILRNDDKIVKLTNSQKKVITHFVTNANRVVTRAEMCEIVGVNDERSVDVLVTRLRQKIIGEGLEDYIVTVRNVGYKFVV